MRRSLTKVAHGPVSLVEHPGLTQGLDWWVEQLDDRDRRRLEAVGVPTLRRVIARQPSLLNDAGMAGMVRMLRSFDFAVGVRTQRTGPPYLIGLGERRLVVGCLVRGGQGATPSPGALRTFASVAWCGWSIVEQTPSLALELNQWFMFGRTPHPELVRFLEDGDHSVSWFQSGHMELGPRTRLRWLSPRPATRSEATRSAVAEPTAVIEIEPSAPPSVSFRRRPMGAD